MKQEHILVGNKSNFLRRALAEPSSKRSATVCTGKATTYNNDRERITICHYGYEDTTESDFKEVRQKLLPLRGHNRFGMKLDTMDWILLMP